MTWRDEAACRDADTDIFFDYHRQDEALSLCESCPVRRECFDYAVSRDGAINDIQGVWGGKTEKQIQRIRASMPRKANPLIAVQPCGTPAAYRRHIRNGERPCHRCTFANTYEKQKERNTA